MRSRLTARAIAGPVCCALLLAGEAIAATSTQAPAVRTLLAAPPRAIRAFTLTDQDGKPFGLAQLAGKPALVFFGFTHCPDVCPAALQRLKLLQKQHASELGGARIVFVSVDGERDTPAVVKKYLADISKDFIGLTGAARAVHDVAAQFSASFFGGKAIEHSGQIYLIDASGRLRATFYDASLKTMADVTREAASG